MKGKMESMKRSKRFHRLAAMLFGAWLLLTAVLMVVRLTLGQTSAAVWALRIYSCVLTPALVCAEAVLFQKARQAARRGTE